MRLFLKAYLLISIVPYLLGCDVDFRKELDLPPENINVISIQDHEGNSASLKDKLEIEYVLSQLQLLKTRKEGKVSPEFELVFQTHDGEHKKFRMSKRCIGPDVPASTVTTRWYFTNDALYSYFRDKLKGGK